MCTLQHIISKFRTSLCYCFQTSILQITYLNICLWWFSTSASNICFSDSLSCSFAICSKSFQKKNKKKSGNPYSSYLRSNLKTWDLLSKQSELPNQHTRFPGTFLCNNRRCHTCTPPFSTPFRDLNALPDETEIYMHLRQPHSPVAISALDMAFATLVCPSLD